MRPVVAVARVALLLPLLTLGGCFCAPTSSGDDAGAVELDRFVPVTVVSLAASSPVRGVALVRPGTVFVVRGGSTPDHWAVLPGLEPVHVVARGPAAAPEQTTLTWGDSTLTLTHDGAAITGGTYTGPDGVEVPYEERGGTREQAVVVEDIDRGEPVLDDTLRYLEAGCAPTTSSATSATAPTYEVRRLVG